MSTALYAKGTCYRLILTASQPPQHLLPIRQVSDPASSKHVLHYVAFAHVQSEGAPVVGTSCAIYLPSRPFSVPFSPLALISSADLFGLIHTSSQIRPCKSSKLGPHNTSYSTFPSPAPSLPFPSLVPLPFITLAKSPPFPSASSALSTHTSTSPFFPQFQGKKCFVNFLASITSRLYSADLGRNASGRSCSITTRSVMPIWLLAR